MKAAIYVRKSTEQTGDDREQSTERQAEACREFIAKQPGWTLGKIYDEGSGVSGTIDHTDRPQLAQLLADARKKPRPFDVLVVWRDDRLSREGAGAITLLDKLGKLGIRVFHANTGREATVKGTGLVVASAEAYGAASFASKIQEDTSAARLRRFRTIEGWASGSPPFGYKTERRGAVAGDKRSGHSVLVIDPAQSATVKRIFEWVANGHPVRGIARQLSAEGVPAPRGRAGWRLWTTSLICRNETYTGVTSFNGETRRSESIRIIPDALFAKVQRILDKNVSRYAAHRDAGGRLKGRPEGSGKVTAYAFSDLLICGVCGSKLWLVRDPRSGIVRARCKRSIGVAGSCRNIFGTPYTKITEAILALIRKVSPEHLRALYEGEAAKRSADASGVAVEVAAKRRELATLDAKVEKLLDALESGEPVGDRLKARQAEKDAVEASLAALEARQAEVDTAAFDWPAWIVEAAKFPEVLRTVLAHGAVTGHEGVHGRALLKVLFPKPVTVTPVIEGGKPVDWKIDANLNTDPIFQGAAQVKKGIFASEGDLLHEAIDVIYPAAGPTASRRRRS